ncbi:hypothetical protein [Corynebacterium aquilae]|uniref:Uncharacterized protein n=1 Tax=Corynebacterium aquilae DSM 44791 TaxID=1431546 RepID=A0A1L7CHI5_9CORY|nr:hypothetical protein [Corynebacterium aquilae]APT85331.1 hypothetical protein CAQU_09940 [Corynebacterium aquilae DSM 44791]
MNPRNALTTFRPSIKGDEVRIELGTYDGKPLLDVLFHTYQFETNPTPDMWKAFAETIRELLQKLDAHEKGYEGELQAVRRVRGLYDPHEWEFVAWCSGGIAAISFATNPGEFYFDVTRKDLERLADAFEQCAQHGRSLQ